MSTLRKEMGLSETRGLTERLFYRLFPPRNSRPGQWLYMHTASTETPVAVSGKKERSACSRLQTPTSKTLCIRKISCVCVAVLRFFVVFRCFFCFFLLLLFFFSLFLFSFFLFSFSKLIWRSASCVYQFGFSYLSPLTYVESVSRLFIYLLMKLTL